MKKILYLLSAITLGGTTSLVTAVQTVTKSSPSSLVDILTTVNIGRVELNDEEHIRTSLRDLNNPIFSHPGFSEVLVFDRITWNRAAVHLEQSIIVEGNRLIPPLITFTIDFTADTFTLATLIPNRNLGVLDDNYSYIILTRLQEENPEIVSSELYLEVSEVYENRAIIRNINATWHRIGQPEIEVNFTTNNYILNSLIHNRNLGELRNNDKATMW
uniref:Hypothetical transmembrane protein n=1 Tax=Spiroplasma citri TaxID=2133 RepID=Q14MC1_SPICI|nr:hypothetical transmembrane protein [Spiroplasma citri]